MGIGSCLQGCSNGLAASGVFRFNMRSILGLVIFMINAMTIANIRY